MLKRAYLFMRGYNGKTVARILFLLTYAYVYLHT